MRRIRPLALAALAAFVLIALSWDTPAPALAVTNGGDWPAYLHDASRSAANGNESTLSPTNAAALAPATGFPFSTGDVVAASPTVSDGVIFVGSWDGNIYAINTSNGTQKWVRFVGQDGSSVCRTPTGPTSSATVQNGVVYVSGGDDQFYALNASTGAVLWHVFTGDITNGNYNWSSPLIYKGFAYLGVASFCDVPLVQGQLMKIDLGGAHTVTRFNVVPNGQKGGGIWTSASVDPATNRVFVVTGNEGQSGQPFSRAMIAINADTMTAVDSFVPPASPTGDADWGTSPILFNDLNGAPRVGAINKDGFFYALNRNSLSTGYVWRRQVANPGPDPESGDASASSSAVGGGRLYVSGGNTTIGGTARLGSVRALNPTTGAILWERGFNGADDGPVLGALAYANGLVVASAGKVVYVLDASNGNILRSFTTGSGIFSAATIANGSIYVGSKDVKVYGFRLNAALDTDGDGVKDVTDNCPGTSNSSQANADSGPNPPAGNTGVIDNGPGVPGDDPTIGNGDTFGDVCDTDKDNDGLPDSQDTEPLGATGICAAFSGASDGHPHPASGDNTNDDNGNGNAAVPMGTDAADNGPSWDTDNDGVPDGYECLRGTNPRDRNSKPAAIGDDAGDDDGDGLPNGYEMRWGTDPKSIDTDRDGKNDCAEVADVDGNGVANFPGDSIAIAKAATNIIGQTNDLDFNKDGVVNFAGDAINHARRTMAVTPCL